MARIASPNMDSIMQRVITAITKQHFALHAEPWNTLTHIPSSPTLPSKTAAALSSILSHFPLVHTSDALSNPLLTSSCYLSANAITLPPDTDLDTLVSTPQRESSTFNPGDTTARSGMSHAIARSKLFAAAVSTLVAFLSRLSEQQYTIWTRQEVQEEFLLFIVGGAHRRASEVIEASSLFGTSFWTRHDAIIELLVRATTAAGMHEDARTAEEGDLDRIEDYMICPAVRRPEMALGGFTIIPLM